MINYLVKSLEFDLVYSVNSFIYILRGLPILKDLSNFLRVINKKKENKV